MSERFLAMRIWCFVCQKSPLKEAVVLSISESAQRLSLQISLVLGWIVSVKLSSERPFPLPSRWLYGPFQSSGTREILADDQQFLTTCLTQFPSFCCSIPRWPRGEKTSISWNKRLVVNRRSFENWLTSAVGRITNGRCSVGQSIFGQPISAKWEITAMNNARLIRYSLRTPYVRLLLLDSSSVAL